MSSAITKNEGFKRGIFASWYQSEKGNMVTFKVSTWGNKLRRVHFWKVSWSRWICEVSLKKGGMQFCGENMVFVTDSQSEVATALGCLTEAFKLHPQWLWIRLLGVWPSVGSSATGHCAANESVLMGVYGWASPSWVERKRRITPVPDKGSGMSHSFIHLF